CAEVRILAGTFTDYRIRVAVERMRDAMDAGCCPYGAVELRKQQQVAGAVYTILCRHLQCDGRPNPTDAEGGGDDTVMDEAERNARLEAYTRQARESVCRIAEDGRTEVGLEVEHDGRWFRTIDHIPGEDTSDEAIEPVVARRAQQIARQMVARDEARRQGKPSRR